LVTLSKVAVIEVCYSAYCVLLVTLSVIIQEHPAVTHISL